MTASKSGGKTLKEAVETYGSLTKAISALTSQQAKLTAQLKETEQHLAAVLTSQQEAAADLESLTAAVDQKRTELVKLKEKLTVAGKQYELYEGFIAMLATSPSAKGGIEPIQYLYNLVTSEWIINLPPEQALDIFIKRVFGDFLRCFHCEYCGASFIVNREAKHTFLHNGYTCPCCGFQFNLTHDTTFLKAMISEDQVENVITTKALLAENATLAPFKKLLGYSCEVCKQPIIGWTDYGVSKGIQGYGWCHDACWNSITGQLMQTMKNFEILAKFKLQLGQTQ